MSVSFVQFVQVKFTQTRRFELREEIKKPHEAELICVILQTERQEGEAEGKRAADGCEMQTIWSVCCAAKFGFIAKQSPDSRTKQRNNNKTS